MTFSVQKQQMSPIFFHQVLGLKHVSNALAFKKKKNDIKLNTVPQMLESH